MGTEDVKVTAMNMYKRINVTFPCIILEIRLVAIIVLCGVVTTIEGTQKSKRFFLTLRGLRFYCILSWARAINRNQFKVWMSTKVCSNNFVRGYRTSECPTPNLYITAHIR